MMVTLVRARPDTPGTFGRFPHLLQYPFESQGFAGWSSADLEISTLSINS